MRNVLSKTPPTHRQWASAALKAIFAMESRESALAKAESVAAEMEARRLKAAANCLREGVGETTTYLLPEFPDGHRRRIRTNNMIERLNREIRRRTRVVGSFPDGNSAPHARLREDQIRHRQRMVDPPLPRHVPTR